MTVPTSIGIPPLPPLVRSDSSGEGSEPTNTLALLLPHLALFTPPVLALLRSYYEQYGLIKVWAPVKGFGRVIIVYSTEAEASTARREGDRLELDLDAGKPEQDAPKETSKSEANGTYFNSRKRKLQQNRSVLDLTPGADPAV